MVFHYTNFVSETNAWWCRRVRPLWLVPTLLLITGAGYRYIFFGKIQAYRNKYLTTDEQREQHAELNKRSYGYNSFYTGNNLERSRKRLILELQGKNYKQSEQFAEQYMCETRDLLTLMEEENSEEWD